LITFDNIFIFVTRYKNLVQNLNGDKIEYNPEDVPNDQSVVRSVRGDKELHEQEAEWPVEEVKCALGVQPVEELLLQRHVRLLSEFARERAFVEEVEYDEDEQLDDGDHPADPTVEAEELHVRVRHEVDREDEQVEQPREDGQRDHQVQLDGGPEFGQLACGHAEQQGGHDHVREEFEQIAHEVQEGRPHPVALLDPQVDPIAQTVERQEHAGQVHPHEVPLGLPLPPTLADQVHVRDHQPHEHHEGHQKQQRQVRLIFAQVGLARHELGVPLVRRARLEVFHFLHKVEFLLDFGLPERGQLLFAVHQLYVLESGGVFVRPRVHEFTSV